MIVSGAPIERCPGCDKGLHSGFPRNIALQLRYLIAVPGMSTICKASEGQPIVRNEIQSGERVPSAGVDDGDAAQGGSGSFNSCSHLPPIELSKLVKR